MITATNVVESLLESSARFCNIQHYESAEMSKAMAQDAIGFENLYVHFAQQQANRVTLLENLKQCF